MTMIDVINLYNDYRNLILRSMSAMNKDLIGILESELDAVKKHDKSAVSLDLAKTKAEEVMTIIDSYYGHFKDELERIERILKNKKIFCGCEMSAFHEIN